MLTSLELSHPPSLQSAFSDISQEPPQPYLKGSYVLPLSPTLFRVPLFFWCSSISLSQRSITEII